MAQIKSAGVIGAGVIGSGWIARLLLNGVNVLSLTLQKKLLKTLTKLFKMLKGHTKTYSSQSSLRKEILHLQKLLLMFLSLQN